jgi:hypothetical protein
VLASVGVMDRRRLSRIPLLVAAAVMGATGVLIADAATQSNTADAAVPAGTKTVISGDPNGIAVLSVGINNNTCLGYIQVLHCG